MFTDIRFDSLLFRHAPPAWHPYIRLARLDRPAGTWLLLLPCWWGLVLGHDGFPGMDARGWGQMALFAAGALLMRAAGCTVNDLWDSDIDAQVERTKPRPLAAGEITRRQALLFLSALLAPAFLILLCLPAAAIILGLLSVPLVAVYPLMKRVTCWPQAFLGAVFNWGALMGWAAARGELGWPAFFLWAGGIAWTLAYDTIYAHQDREDDTRLGLGSTALLFGEKSRAAVAGFFALAILLIVTAKYMAFPSVMTLLLLLPLIAQAGRQALYWDMNDPQSCLDTFRSNRTFGLLALLLLGL